MDDNSNEIPISLRHAIHCLISGDVAIPEYSIPVTEYDFPTDTPEFQELLLGILDGSLATKGDLACIEINFVAEKLDAVEGDNKFIRNGLRKDNSFMKVIAAEQVLTAIPKEAWWYEGSIWERSILWVRNPDSFAPSIKGIPKLPIKLPYREDKFSESLEPELIELVCFLEVALNLSEFRQWMTIKHRPKKTGKKSTKPSGRPTSEDWEKIDGWIALKLDEGFRWPNWGELWHAIPLELKNPDFVGSASRSDTLRKHLAEKNRALRDRVSAGSGSKTGRSEVD